MLCKAERKVKQENHRECYLTRVFIRNGESGSEGEMFTGLFNILVKIIEGFVNYDLG